MNSRKQRLPGLLQIQKERKGEESHDRREFTPMRYFSFLVSKKEDRTPKPDTPKVASVTERSKNNSKIKIIFESKLCKRKRQVVRYLDARTQCNRKQKIE